MKQSVVWGIILGFIAIITMLILIPVLVSVAESARWANVEAAIDYLNDKGYYASAASAMTAGRGPLRLGPPTW